MYRWLLIFLGMITMPGAFAQNAPVTSVPVLCNTLPGTVTVPVTITGFTNIAAFSLTLDYEYAGMTWVQGTKNPALGGTFSIYDTDIGNNIHRITISWFGSAVSLPDGSASVTMTFMFITGVSSLTWFDNGGSCQYFDGNANPLNDLPTSDYYINGGVYGILPSPGPISGSMSVCIGQTGVYYSIVPVPGAESYTWTVPPGAVISGGGTGPWIYADYPPGSYSGYVSAAAVNACGTGPSSQLPVMVNPLPVADAGNDTVIPYGTSTTLHAADGGTGNFTYHWSPGSLLIDPDVQDPQTVNLYSTNVFTVLVTNSGTGCQNSDGLVVAVTGGPLTVNPVAVPDSIYSGSASRLYANAGGGSGTYTYLWTCTPAGNPPWSSDQPDPLVTPDTTTLYTVTVSDGFNYISGDVTVTVMDITGTGGSGTGGSGTGGSGTGGSGTGGSQTRPGINIYPNPCHALLWLQCTEPNRSLAGIRIVTFTGETVIRIRGPLGGISPVGVEISGLARGIYLLVAEDANGPFDKKVFLAE